MLVEGMVSPLQPGDHGLRRSHYLGDPFLRLVGVAARLDDRGGDGELVFQRVMGRDKIPGPSATPARALGVGCISGSCTSFAHLRGVGLSLISRFPKPAA